MNKLRNVKCTFLCALNIRLFSFVLFLYCVLYFWLFFIGADLHIMQRKFGLLLFYYFKYFERWRTVFDLYFLLLIIFG